MPNIKIVQKGFEGFNGYFEGVKFENGLSTEPLTITAAERLGGQIKIEDADTGESVSVTQRLLDRERNSAPVGRTTMTKEEADKAIKQGKADKLKEEKVKEPDYTREQLEKIADEGGITALREFSKQYNVNGVSIKTIIDTLMNKL